MKAILYAGAVLMTGASIYGFIDYKKTSQRKEFTSMYKTGENGTVTKTTPSPAATTSNEVKKEIVEAKDKPVAVNKKKTKQVIAVAEEKKAGKELTRMTINPVEPVKTETISSANMTPKPSSIKRKTVSIRLFSRARPAREYINKEARSKTKKGKQ